MIVMVVKARGNYNPPKCAFLDAGGGNCDNPRQMKEHRTESLFEREPQDAGGRIVRIAFDSGVDNTFDYILPEELWPVEPGQRLRVPFGRGNRAAVGYCIAADVEPVAAFKGRRLKRVLEKVDEEPLLNGQLMQLASWISRYYVCPPGQVLSAMLPAAVKKGTGTKTEMLVYLDGKTPLDELLAAVRGAKQKAILAALYERGAFGADSAVESSELLAEADCGPAPLKNLMEKSLVHITRRAIYASLPAVPDSAAITPEIDVVLNDDQQAALEHINERLAGKRFSVTLLHGVTDSGKTEVYIRAIEAAVADGRSAIVLLPEIALTTQTVQRFAARFEKIAVLHSGLTAAQRNSQWRLIKSGGADVVIGARSAVFAPLDNLGLIVVDEEHEPSYKQDAAPRYHGRDTAIKRAQLAGAHCILGSATPSLESLHNCSRLEHFDIVRLPRRVNDLPMPEMRLIDLSQAYFPATGQNLISEPLEKHLKIILEKGEQAILLLNRRGYSSYIFCPSCKYTLHCRNCDVTLTFHKKRFPGRDAIDGSPTVAGKHMAGGYALCHYCMSQTLVPAKCPLCSTALINFGFGSQRIEEEIARKFPAATVARVDSDSMGTKDYYRILGDFAQGKIDILSGTQMLAKGLHFPNVTLVGIISADTSLAVPDFRASERTFQLISQVAGRAGRSEKGGTVFIQTFLPDQPAIRFAIANDFAGFVAEESKHRMACNLPPYWRLAVVHLSGENYERLTDAADTLRGRIDAIVLEDALKLNIRGPMPSTIDRIQRAHRMQIIVEAPSAATMQRLLDRIRPGLNSSSQVRTMIDVDPTNLL